MQPSATPVTQSVSFPSGRAMVRGYLARPAGSGPFPGIVVIHEIFGLNDNIKEIARRFAGEGYAALAVDLFAGRNRALCMARFMTGLISGSVEPFGVGDLKAALSFLAEQPEVDAARIGAIGFCMGGGLAIAWACTDDRLKAIAPYYGIAPRKPDIVARACPVVGSYPDPDFTTAHARRLDAALDTYGIAHDIKIYPGARHSFFNDQGSAYNAAAAQDSWQRTLAFFAEHISR